MEHNIYFDCNCSNSLDTLIYTDENSGEKYVRRVSDVSELESLQVRGTLLGVYTFPESPPLIELKNFSYSKVLDDAMLDKLLPAVTFGHLYDVCYYPNAPSAWLNAELADLRQTAGDIYIHLGTQRYAEGAVIYDHSHMLTAEEYLSGMRYHEPDARRQMNAEQLHELKLAAAHHLDLKPLLHPELSSDDLRKIRMKLEFVKTQKRNSLSGKLKTAQKVAMQGQPVMIGPQKLER